MLKVYTVLGSFEFKMDKKPYFQSNKHQNTTGPLQNVHFRTIMNRTGEINLKWELNEPIRSVYRETSIHGGSKR